MESESAALQVHHWILDKRRAAMMTVVSLALFPVAWVLFSFMSNVMHPADDGHSLFHASFAVRPNQSMWPIMLAGLGLALLPIVFTVIVLVFHEWCHGRAFQWAGAKPRYGAKLVSGFMPVLYATAPGAWLTRRQYLVVILTPTAVVNLLGVLLMWPPTPLHSLLIMPLSFNFWGCVGDWWMSLVLSRFPANTLFEDAEDGFRYREA